MLLLLVLLFVGVSENLVGYLWLSVVSLRYVLMRSGVVLLLFLTPLAMGHLYRQSSNIVLMSLTKPLYAAILFSILPGSLAIVAALCFLFPYVAETRLQWLTVGRGYYILFSSTNLPYAGILVFMYLCRLTTMNVIVLVLRLPITAQGFLKGGLGSCRPGGLWVYMFLAMVLLFIAKVLVIDVSATPNGVQESTIMVGGLVI